MTNSRTCINPFPNHKILDWSKLKVCRWQFQILWKWQKDPQRGRKHVGKRRNCSLWAISPFSTVFSKDLCCRHIKPRACFILLFKHIYFTSIEKQVLTTYTNLSLFCFLGTTPVLAPNVWTNEKSQFRPAPRTQTRDLMIARLTLYLTTTDTTNDHTTQFTTQSRLLMTPK